MRASQGDLPAGGDCRGRRGLAHHAAATRATKARPHVCLWYLPLAGAGGPCSMRLPACR
jgi:hypothetical protein